MPVINVKSKYTGYPVLIGQGVLNSLNDYIKDADRVLLVSDSNVAKIYPGILSLIEGHNPDPVVLPAGEKNKTISSVTKILDALHANRFTRDSVVIAFGGGVVGDITGFAASIYMRGIKVIQIPTTLLSMVDSSVGGKTGIDYKGIKNLVGSFYNPSAVFIDPYFLESLPKEEFISGMGEVLKYKFLIGSKFYKRSFDFINEIEFKKYLGGTEGELIDVINECISFKSSVCEIDEHDTGLRKILNLGHTFGHAYESASNYKIKHGAAVALGMISSFHLSYLNKFISKVQLKEYLNVVNEIPVGNYRNKIDLNKAVNALKLDKKSLKGSTAFVLVKSPGEIITDFIANPKHVLKAVELTFK